MAKLMTNNGYEFEVDDEDVEAVLKEGKWYGIKYKDNSYRIVKHIYKNKKMTTLHLYRWLLGLENNPEIQIDHRNHITHDNKINNLRPCSHFYNSRNQNKKYNKKYNNQKCSSIYKGVCFDKCRNTWNTSIGVNYKNINLGRFKSEFLAALRYDEEAKKLFKSFAHLNFPAGSLTSISNFYSNI